MWLATGTAFADALTAGPAAAASGGLLMLVDGTSAISEEVAAGVRSALGR